MTRKRIGIRTLIHRRLMPVFRVLGVVVLVLVPNASVGRAEETPPPFIPDRPGAGDSPFLVAPGYVQLETGVNVDWDETTGGDVTRVTVPTNLVRLGTHRLAELRVFGPDYVFEETVNVTTEEVRGFNPPVVGTKLFLAVEDGWIPHAALLINATLPVGKREFRPNDVTPDFRVAAEHTLTEQLTWAWNLGGVWDDAVRNLTGIYTTSLEVALAPTVVGFGEVFGNMNGPATAEFDAGLQYLFMPLGDMQFDISGGVKLTEEARDAFVAAGVTYRFPRAW